MSQARGRSGQQRVGYVHWTVEAEPTDIDHNLARNRSLAAATEKLFELFNRHHQPATWAVGDPAHSAVAGLVTKSTTKHALALLGDRYWIGQTAGRTRFARELARRASQARAAGIETVTLVPRVASVAEHIDLVVKHDIHAVVTTNEAASSAPRSVHYGVWEFGVKARLPQPMSWLPGSGWKLARSIQRAAREAATVHLLIDASAVEEAGGSVTRSVERLLKRTAKLQDRGLVHVETLSAAVARLSERPAATPQRSILRAA
ncbi:MAG: hypothetical protein AB7G28_04745 [Pirellulales bacterium]